MSNTVSEQELLNRAHRVGQKYEAYKTQVFALEVYKANTKAFLAQIKAEIRKVSGKISETELENRAIESQTWQEFVAKETQKLIDAGLAKAEMEEAMVQYEAMRSALSSRKKEMETFRG